MFAPVGIVTTSGDGMIVTSVPCGTSPPCQVDPTFQLPVRIAVRSVTAAVTSGEHHYRILERLGSGGMGDVFRAEDTRLHRTVALKLLRCSASEKDAEARLLREARAAATLNHPSIATVYEIGEMEHAG